MAKLEDEQLVEALVAEPDSSDSELAKRFGVTPATIRRRTAELPFEIKLAKALGTERAIKQAVASGLDETKARERVKASWEAISKAGSDAWLEAEKAGQYSERASAASAATFTEGARVVGLQGEPGQRWPAGAEARNHAFEHGPRKTAVAPGGDDGRYLALVRPAPKPSGQPVGHPVLDVILSRRSEDSRPGKRRDDFRVGLAIEGGGLRGVVSGGMLAALEELRLRDAFDVVYGSSAGAFNATYFLTGQAWEALPLYYNEMTSNQFLDLRRLLTRKPAISLDWVLEVGMGRLVPLSWPEVIDSDIPIQVIASSITDLRTLVFSGFSSANDLKAALKASACIPMLAGPPIEFRGHRLLDAAVLQAHPYESAIADSCTHVLSLSTRPEGRLRDRPGLIERITSLRLERIKPGLGRGYLERIRAYRGAQLRLRELSTGPTEPPFVLDVAPAAATPEVSQLERNALRILEGGQAGYEAALLAIEGTPVRSFYRLARSPRR